MRWIKGKARLLVAALVFAARRLAQYEPGKLVAATASAISDAVRWAERIMEEIDRRWGAKERDRINMNLVDRKGTP